MSTEDIGYVTNPGRTHALTVLTEDRDEHFAPLARAALLALGSLVDVDLGTPNGYTVVTADRVGHLLGVSGSTAATMLLALEDRFYVRAVTRGGVDGWRLPEDIRVPTQAAAS